MELLEYITILAPGLVSVFGIIAGVILGAAKLIKAINEFRCEKDKLIEELRASDSAYKAQVQTLLDENRELLNAVHFLTDNITRVRGYGNGQNKNSKV